jgi:hypothetical protein
MASESSGVNAVMERGLPGVGPPHAAKAGESECSELALKEMFGREVGDGFVGGIDRRQAEILFAQMNQRRFRLSCGADDVAAAANDQAAAAPPRQPGRRPVVQTALVDVHGPGSVRPDVFCNAAEDSPPEGLGGFDENCHMRRGERHVANYK